MSNYHILTQASDKKTATVVFHLPVPDAQNQATKSCRTALTEWLIHTKGSIESACPDVSSTELTQLQNGELYEVVRSVRFSSLSLTNLEKRNELDAEYNRLTIESINELKTVLEWWGFNRNVPT